MKSYSKINLALSIVNKTKPNGLHELDSLNLITSLHDVIKVKFYDEGNDIKISSNKDIPLDENNLVSKVINKFKKVFNLTFSVDVTIIKNIPIQAGLGGGSSNAACMLDILNKKFKTNMNALEKINFLKDITSDGPLFVLNTTCRVKGKGNIISPIKRTLCAGPRFYFSFFFSQSAVKSKTSRRFVSLRISCRPLGNRLQVTSFMPAFWNSSATFRTPFP